MQETKNVNQYRPTTGHEARNLYELYTFRCTQCGTEWPSDGTTQPCPKCLRETGDGWTKQEVVRFPQ